MAARARIVQWLPAVATVLGLAGALGVAAIPAQAGTIHPDSANLTVFVNCGGFGDGQAECFAEVFGGTGLLRYVWSDGQLGASDFLFCNTGQIASVSVSVTDDAGDSGSGFDTFIC
jgi:hypothetical protein